MSVFTELELAVLRSIFSETPEFASSLDQQRAVSTVTSRINTGNGFFTSISVGEEAPLVKCRSPLGGETNARIHGLKHGLGFNLFMEGGRLHELEGFGWGEESTSTLNFYWLKFEVYRQPFIHVR